MDRFQRFQNLEKARKPAPSTPGRPASLEERFGGPVSATPPPSDTAQGLASGVENTRFREEPQEPLRTIDADDGQSFARCVHCHRDNHLTATRCIGCDADLATAEQRAFNEALWRSCLEEQAELRQEAARLDALRERAEQDLEKAWRRLRLRRGPRLGQNVFVLEAGLASRLGLYLGNQLRRFFPNRRVRWGILAAALASLLTPALLYPDLLLPLAGLIALVCVLSYLRR